MYFYNPISQTGNAAQTWAQNYGANLISVQSAAENACIVSELNTNGFGGIIWIGFNDVANEASHVWYDQSAVIYTNWHAGEPNNSGDEDCVQIYPDGQWNDLSCSSGGSKSVIEVNLCPNTTITASALSICAGQSVNLAASTILGSSPYTYSWTSTSGLFSSTNPSPTVTPASTTTYNVTSTDRYGCTASASIQITVNNSLNATLTGTTALCKDEPSPNITFTGNSGTAPYTFTYTINSGATQTITTTSGSSVNLPVTTGSTGVFTYTLMSVSDANGCSQAQSGSAVITIADLPTATISGTDTVCGGTTAPLITFSGSGGITPYTFTYSINGGANQTVNSGSGNDGTVSASTVTSGIFTYTLVSVQSASSATCAQAQSGNAVITVNPLPTASITGTTAVCKDASAPNITFTGANGTAPYTFTYTINSGSNQTITTTSGNSITVPVPASTAGIFTYSLVSVSDAALVSCSQTQSGSAIVTVNPIPTATISGTTTICKDATAPDITFTGAGGTAPYKFTYKVNGVTLPTVTTNTGNTITVSVPTSVTGVFTYQLISVQDASSSACSQLQNGSVVITINSIPTAAITGTAAVCKDAAAPNVTFTGANGISPYTFTYNINGGTSQTVTTTFGNSVTVSAPTATTGIFTYSLISVQDGSSSICGQPQTGDAVITVNSLPTATISGATSICKDAASPSITFTGAGTTPPYTFTYTINNGANQTVSSANGSSVATVSANTSVSGVFTYSLVSVLDASQTACSQTQSGSVIITVNPLPTAAIMGSTSVCEDALLPPITLTGAGATAPYTFTYTLNGGTNQTISTTSGNSVTIYVPTSTNGNFTYTLFSVTESGPIACAQAQTGNATVTVNPKPVVDFVTNTITGCVPLCINFTNQSSIATGSNSSVVWDFGDGATGSAANNCYQNNTIYSPLSFNVSLTVTSDSACVNSLTKTNYITVYPKPVADFTIDPSIANIINPVISTTNLSLGSVLWDWDFGDLDTSALQNPLPHTYSDTGRYEIRLIASNQYNCKDSSYHSVTIEPHFIFYIPSAFSPNDDGFNDLFFCKGLFAIEFEMKIFDRWGNMVFSSNNVDLPWDGRANKGTEIAQPDVYVYSIKVIDINKKKHDYKGIVTLVR